MVRYPQAKCELFSLPSFSWYLRLLLLGLFIGPFAMHWLVCSFICEVFIDLFMYQPVRVDIRLRLRFDVLLIITCVLHFKGWGEGTWY